MGDQEAELRPRRRTPGANAGVGAGLKEIDRRLAAALMVAGGFRLPGLAGAPTEFGRLQTFRHETVDRPSVAEDIHRMRDQGALGVALGDMDALDADRLHQPGPLLAASGRRVGDAHVAGEVLERHLDEPGDHAGVGTAAGDGGGATGIAVFLGSDGLA